MTVNLIKKIKGIFGNQPSNAPLTKFAPSELLDSPDDKRRHGRFHMGAFHTFSAKGNGMPETELFDLSYGGFALKIPDRANAEALAKDGVFEIGFFHRRARCQALYVNTRHNTMGFSFMHTGTESLLFLRSLIEPLKAGDSMKPIPKDVINDKYDASEHLLLRGLGPSDIVIKSQRPNRQKIDEGSINYLQDGYYREVKFADGHIITNGSIEEGFNSRGRFVKDNIDYDDVLTTTLILMGAYTHNQSPALMDWIDHHCQALRTFHDNLAKTS